ncbi:hypothetical protein ZWY2020_052164 [Hordeum vulgare]|nr:hypothetical protein ZWY2020_052162 [Hordeum vulgare]KAI4996822.1 hypothetical protein ZWY2020_052164 [Hordeum vulgare]
MDVASADTRAPITFIELLRKLSSPAASSRVIGKNKWVQLQAGGGAYECRTCGRRFATFQALGGHRTSHKRPRVRAHGLDLLLGARPGKATAPVQLHRCGTCGQAFPTRQALGGHLRGHSQAVPAATWTETATWSSTSCLSGQDDDADWPTLIQFI